MVELMENVRGRDVFVLAIDVRADERQPDGDHGDGRCAEARVGRAHHRGDPVLRLRAPGPAPALARVAITAKVVADMLSTVGVQRVMVMDLHADQIQGFFNIPVDNIYATPILLGDLWKRNYEDLLVVSPTSAAWCAHARSRSASTPTSRSSTSGGRRRTSPKVMNIIGDVEGRTCVIMDDIVDTANTLCKRDRAEGARRGKVVAMHASGAVGRRGAGSRVRPRRVVVTTRSAVAEAQALPRDRQLSCAQLWRRR
jgi:ribose-phosphate pyrophosphokinase